MDFQSLKDEANAKLAQLRDKLGYEAEIGFAALIGFLIGLAF